MGSPDGAYMQNGEGGESKTVKLWFLNRCNDAADAGEARLIDFEGGALWTWGLKESVSGQMQEGFAE